MFLLRRQLLSLGRIPKELDSIVTEITKSYFQLVAEVAKLTQQVTDARERESVSLQTSRHLVDGETMKGDDSTLVAMLQSDLDRISAERCVS